MDAEEKNAGWSPEEYAELTGFEGEWRDSWWNQDFLELMARRWERCPSNKLVRPTWEFNIGAGTRRVPENDGLQ